MNVIKDVGDWLYCTVAVVALGIVVLMLCLTPFFDDWDDDAHKGE